MWDTEQLCHPKILGEDGGSLKLGNSFCHGGINDITTGGNYSAKFFFTCLIKTQFFASHSSLHFYIDWLCRFAEHCGTSLLRIPFHFLCSDVPLKFLFTKRRNHTISLLENHKTMGPPVQFLLLHSRRPNNKSRVSSSLYIFDFFSSMLSFLFENEFLNLNHWLAGILPKIACFFSFCLNKVFLLRGQ